MVGEAEVWRQRIHDAVTRHPGRDLRELEFRFIVVPTEVDALLLENSLIKEHQPRYNIELKDDKTYPSIVIRKERFPRIHSTRNIIQNGSEYFGPYASAKTMHAVLDIVRAATAAARADDRRFIDALNCNLKCRFCG